jgi:hypothetical protein
MRHCTRENPSVLAWLLNLNRGAPLIMVPPDSVKYSGGWLLPDSIMHHVKHKSASVNVHARHTSAEA